MRTDCFSEESLRAAYQQAAEKAQCDFEDFAEGSKFYDFAVTNLGGGLSIDVECDTTMPQSTPAELREKKFQKTLAKSQIKANKILKRQTQIQAKQAKQLERKMRKEQRKK